MNSPTNTTYQFNPIGWLHNPDGQIAHKNNPWRCSKASLDVVKAHLKRGNQCVEYLEGKTIVKPYFDYDYEVETEYEMNKEKSILFSRYRSDLRAFFKKHHNTELIPNVNEWWCERHGINAKGNYKISFRAYVTGFTTTVAKLHTLIPAGGNPELYGADPAIYGLNGQKVKMIYSTKSMESNGKDKRMLDFCHGYTPNLEATIVQHTDPLSKTFLPDLKVTKKINIKKPKKKAELNVLVVPGLPDDYKSQKLALILNCIDKQYYEDFSSWSRICWSIYNELRSIFSDKDSKSKTIQICEYMNHKYKITDTGVTDFVEKIELIENEEARVKIGTLIEFANRGSQQKKAQALVTCWNDTAKRNTILKTIASVGITHSNSAELFFVGNREQYVFSNNEWYEQNEYGLYKKVVSAMASMSKKVGQYIYNQLYKYEGSLSMDDENDGKRANLNKAKITLQTKSFKRDTIELMSAEYLDDDFVKNLDEKHHLIGFDNGVYDIKEGTFRKATKDDCISKSVGYDFLQLDPESEEIKKAENVIRGWFPDEDVQDYVLRLCGSLIHGGNPEELCYFLHGIGGNGKGVFANILHRVFGRGQYSQPLNVAYFVTEKTSGKADPELLNIKGTRVVQLQEPAKGKTYLADKLKEMTGRDTLYARMLHQNGDKQGFIPQCILVFQCNTLPELNEGGEGVLRRVRVIYFSKKYVTQEDWDKGFDFLLKKYPTIKDPKFFGIGNVNYETEVVNPISSNVFMNLFIKWYKVYQQKNMNVDVPEEVTKHTNKYKKSLNRFPEWFNENYREATGKMVVVEKILDDFVSDECKMNNRQLKAALEEMGLQISRRLVNGRKRRVVLDYEEIEMEEAQVNAPEECVIQSEDELDKNSDKDD